MDGSRIWHYQCKPVEPPYVVNSSDCCWGCNSVGNVFRSTLWASSNQTSMVGMPQLMWVLLHLFVATNYPSFTHLPLPSVATDMKYTMTQSTDWFHENDNDPSVLHCSGHQIWFQQSSSAMWKNGRFAAWMCRWQIVSSVMQSCQHGPGSQSLFSECHAELRLFLVQTMWNNKVAWECTYAALACGDVLHVSGRVSVLSAMTLQSHSDLQASPPEEVRRSMAHPLSVSLSFSLTFSQIHVFYSFYAAKSHAVREKKNPNLSFCLSSVASFSWKEMTQRRQSLSFILSVCHNDKQSVRLTCYTWASHGFSGSARLLHYVNISAAVPSFHARLMSVWNWRRY